VSRPGSTIAAVATGPAAGGVGILRISGPLAVETSRPLAPDLPPGPPQPRHAYFTRFTDRRGGVLDEGLYLSFQAPASFTGEDVVEFHAHGSPRLLSLLLAEVLADDRIRLAEPGEFSRRALLNGRTDLARAEGWRTWWPRRARRPCAPPPPSSAARSRSRSRRCGGRFWSCTRTWRGR
jgi:tRNA modification GTPase